MREYKDRTIERERFVNYIDPYPHTGGKSEWSISQVCENDYEVCITRYAEDYDNDDILPETIHFTAYNATALDIYHTYRKVYPKAVLKLYNKTEHYGYVVR